jgi:hypothetical protein
MKLLIVIMLATSGLSALAAQNSAQDINCCQTCKTEQAIACRGMAQKRIIVPKTSGSPFSGNSKSRRAKSSQANQG